jgi:hypothetical protein
VSLFSPKPQGQQNLNSRLFGIQVSTSCQGRPRALGWGRFRAPGNVIWSGNWQATPVSGGKLKGSGGKGGAQQFNYFVSLLYGLCEGPLDAAPTNGQQAGILNIWSNKDEYTLQPATEHYTITSPYTYGSKIPANSPTTVGQNGPGAYAINNGVAYQEAYSQQVNDYGSPSPSNLSGNMWVPMTLVAGSPSAGEYTLTWPSGSNQPVVYGFSSSDNGKFVQIQYMWENTNTSTTDDTLTHLNLELFEGAQGQSPSSYVTAYTPNQALGYSQLAYVLAWELILGTSGMVPNLVFEVQKGSFGGGIVDWDPADVVTDFLVNPLYGVPGWTAADLPATNVNYGWGVASQMWTYCASNSIFVSPYLDEQRTAASFLKDITELSNCEGFWSEGLLKCASYGDTTAVGNGATFTPQTNPVFDFDNDDFICGPGEAPIKIKRKSIRDANNRATVEWLNRANAYTAEPVAEQIDWAVNQYSVRSESRSYHAICNQTTAQKVASTLVKNWVYKLNEYTFTVPIYYMQVDPMDLGTITSNYLGFNKYPVRILSIEENDKLQLEITAEDFPWGTAGPTEYGKQVNAAFGPGYFANPGSVNQPQFVQLAPETEQGNDYVLGIALSGSQNWGGCQVYVSTDGGDTYNALGTQANPSTMGVLTAALPAGADPDTTDTLAIDLTESYGDLADYTQAEADAFQSLIAVENELLSYETATLTSPNAYGLTYLRRGVYNSIDCAHPSGAPFCVPSTMFQWAYPTSVIGKTVYFKFCSFNQAGGSLENIANVAPYPYFVAGPRTPFPWAPGNTSAPSGDPINTAETFGMLPSLLAINNGALVPAVSIYGNPPLNAFTNLISAPVLNSAMAVVSGGVKWVNTTVGGSEYLNGGSGTFPLTFGSGAAAGYAVVVNGVVINSIMTDGSSGYGSAPGVSYVDPAGTGGGATGTAVLSSGGSVAAGTYALAVDAFDAAINGLETPLSGIVEVVAASGSSEIVYNVTWPAGAYGGNVFVASPDATHPFHYEAAPGAGGATTGVANYDLTAIAGKYIGPPDTQFNNLQFQVTLTRHSGVWAEQVIPGGVGSFSLQFGGASGTVSTWVGRVLSLIWTYAAGVAVPVYDATITSASITSGVVTLGLSVDPTGIVNAGDLLTMSFQASSITPTSFVDTLVTN